MERRLWQAVISTFSATINPQGSPVPPPATPATPLLTAVAIVLEDILASNEVCSGSVVDVALQHPDVPTRHQLVELLLRYPYETHAGCPYTTPLAPKTSYRATAVNGQAGPSPAPAALFPMFSFDFCAPVAVAVAQGDHSVLSRYLLADQRINVNAGFPLLLAVQRPVGTMPPNSPGGRRGSGFDAASLAEVRRVLLCCPRVDLSYGEPFFYAVRHRNIAAVQDFVNLAPSASKRACGRLRIGCFPSGEGTTPLLYALREYLEAKQARCEARAVAQRLCAHCSAAAGGALDGLMRRIPEEARRGAEQLRNHHETAVSEWLALLRLLLALPKIDVNKGFFVTPLQVAVQHGDAMAVALLLRHHNIHPNKSIYVGSHSATPWVPRQTPDLPLLAPPHGTRGASSSGESLAITCAAAAASCSRKASDVVVVAEGDARRSPVNAIGGATYSDNDDRESLLFARLRCALPSCCDGSVLVPFYTGGDYTEPEDSSGLFHQRTLEELLSGDAFLLRNHVPQESPMKRRLTASVARRATAAQPGPSFVVRCDPEVLSALQEFFIRGHRRCSWLEVARSQVTRRVDQTPLEIAVSARNGVVVELLLNDEGLLVPDNVLHYLERREAKEDVFALHVVQSVFTSRPMLLRGLASKEVSLGNAKAFGSTVERGRSCPSALLGIVGSYRREWVGLLWVWRMRWITTCVISQVVLSLSDLWFTLGYGGLFVTWTVCFIAANCIAAILCGVAVVCLSRPFWHSPMPLFAVAPPSPPVASSTVSTRSNGRLAARSGKVGKATSVTIIQGDDDGSWGGTSVRMGPVDDPPGDGRCGDALRCRRGGLCGAAGADPLSLSGTRASVTSCSAWSLASGDGSSTRSRKGCGGCRGALEADARLRPLDPEAVGHREATWTTKRRPRWRLLASLAAWRQFLQQRQVLAFIPLAPVYDVWCLFQLMGIMSTTRPRHATAAPSACSREGGGKRSRYAVVVSDGDHSEAWCLDQEDSRSWECAASITLSVEALPTPVTATPVRVDPAISVSGTSSHGARRSLSRVGTPPARSPTQWATLCTEELELAESAGRTLPPPPPPVSSPTASQAAHETGAPPAAADARLVPHCPAPAAVGSAPPGGRREQKIVRESTSSGDSEVGHTGGSAASRHDEPLEPKATVVACNPLYQRPNVLLRALLLREYYVVVIFRVMLALLSVVFRLFVELPQADDVADGMEDNEGSSNAGRAGANAPAAPAPAPAAPPPPPHRRGSEGGTAAPAEAQIPTQGLVTWRSGAAAGGDALRRDERHVAALGRAAPVPGAGGGDGDDDDGDALPSPRAAASAGGGDAVALDRGVHAAWSAASPLLSDLVDALVAAEVAYVLTAAAVGGGAVAAGATSVPTWRPSENRTMAAGTSPSVLSAVMFSEGAVVLNSVMGVVSGVVVIVSGLSLLFLTSLHHVAHR